MAWGTIPRPFIEGKMKLTNVEITFERSVKVADYENKKFGAKFSILVDDGDNADEVVELYGRQIVHYVEDKLGVKSSINLDKPVARPAVAAPEAPTAEPVKKPPGRPKKDTTPTPAPEATEAAPTSAPAPEVPEITDQQLRDAITAHIAKTNTAPMAVRELVQTFFVKKEGKTWASNEIPQDRRPEFLTKLSVLGAAPPKDELADI